MEFQATVRILVTVDEMDLEFAEDVDVATRQRLMADEAFDLIEDGLDSTNLYFSIEDFGVV